MGALIGPKAGLVLELQPTFGRDLIVQNLGYKAQDGGEIVQVVGSKWQEAKKVIEEWLEKRKAEAAAQSRQRANAKAGSAAGGPGAMGALPPPQNADAGFAPGQGETIHAS